ncbi:MAG: PA14 domain-containing protein, partial [Chitinivibrionales bacterium]|nr:PA14 domain-containing protein [Chitinivibrionales bacterium]
MVNRSGNEVQKFCSLAVGVLLFAGVCFFSVSAQTNNAFKVAVTYYDFHQDGSNPDFNWESGPKPVGKSFIMSYLDSARKPILNTLPNLLTCPNKIYTGHLDHLSQWYRPWVAGKMDSVGLPAFSYLVPVIDSTTCGPVPTDTGADTIHCDTKNTLVTIPAHKSKCDTLMKNVMVEDSLEFKAYSGEPGHPNAYIAGDTNIFLPLQNFPLKEHAPGDTSRNTCFTMEFHNQVMYTDNHIIRESSDDDFAIFINDSLVLDDFGRHGPDNIAIYFDSIATKAHLVKGSATPYNIDIFYADRGGWQTMQLITDVQFVHKGAFFTDGVKNPFVNRKADGLYYSVPLNVGAGKAMMLPFHTKSVSLVYFTATGRVMNNLNNVVLGDAQTTRFD